MRPASRLERDIERGLRGLRKLQSRDGGFPAHTSASPDFREYLPERSIFPAAVVLAAISSLPGAEARSIRRSAAAYLLRQKSPGWSWNYWQRLSPESRQRPYPDDLDDTAIVLGGLLAEDKDMVPGRAMAAVVRTLTALEARPGGPYRTWLVPADAPKAFRDVDLAVNANIAYALGSAGIELPGLQEFLKEKIEQDKISSPYYPSPWPIFYYLSRGLQGAGARAMLLKRVRQELKKKVKLSPLACALAASVLLALDAPAEEVAPFVQRVLEAEASGQWPAEAFCIDPKKDGQVFYGGSAALSTAIALEALYKFQRRTARPSAAARSEARVRAEVLAMADRRISSMPADLRRGMAALLDRVKTEDKRGEVILLPQRYWSALRRRSRVSARTVRQLCLGSLWGWMAYTAYDDVMDGDAGPESLPAANAAHRELLLIYGRLSGRAGIGALFSEYMDRVDGGNAWELANCRDATAPPRFGDYRILAERSLGHALGPLTLMLLAGYGRGSRAVRAAEVFFSSYLSARQLNDDAHDWQEDLARGQVNAAAAALLRDRRSRPGADPEKIFWAVTIDKLAAAVRERTGEGRRALSRLQGVMDMRQMEGLILRAEGAMQEALRERDRTLEFIKAYRSAK